MGSYDTALVLHFHCLRCRVCLEYKFNGSIHADVLVRSVPQTRHSMGDLNLRLCVCAYAAYPMGSVQVGAGLEEEESIYLISIERLQTRR
jgi:hypothetical protein